MLFLGAALRMLGRAGSLAFAATPLIAALVAVFLTAGIDWAFSPRRVVPILEIKPIHADTVSSVAAQATLRSWSDLSLGVRLAGNDLVLISATQEPLREKAWRGLKWLLTIVVWLFAGSIIARSVALDVAGRNKSFPRCVRHAISRLPCSLGAVGIPLVATALLGLVIAVTGLPGVVGWWDESWVTLVSPIALVLGLIAAFLFAVLIIGWPFFAVASVVEDADSFGVLSRVYSFLISRPGIALLLAILGLLIGTALTEVARWLGELAQWLVLLSWQPILGIDAEHRAAAALAGWTILAVRTWASAVFWVLVTLIYLLLREVVDGAPIDLVTPDDDDRVPKDPFPVVGLAAMNQPPEELPPSS